MRFGGVNDQMCPVCALHMLESQRDQNIPYNNNNIPAHSTLYELVIHTRQIIVLYNSHVGGYDWSSSYISPPSF